MSTKRSKIVFLEYERDWKSNRGDGGPMHQYRIAFENGDKGAASFQKQPPWAKDGDEVEYDGPTGTYTRSS